VFLLSGLGGVVAALLFRNIIASSFCGVFAFSFFWSIGKLFQQRKRVEIGWFLKR